MAGGVDAVAANLDSMRIYNVHAYGGFFVALHLLSAGH
jgi:hypothetical protein